MTFRKGRLGFVSAVSIVLAFFWVLLVPIFSYEPSSSDFYVPPGTELADSGIQVLAYSKKQSLIKQISI